jgi:sulfide:quinone oxidoreductase
MMTQAPRVIVAGGGVGALEAALAIRDLAGDRVHIELIAPEPAFVYRPLSVAEPFGYARALTMPLSRLRRTHGIVHRRDVVEAVRPGTHEVVLGEGPVVPYDALVLALGARAEAWLPGAVTFTGPRAVPHVRDVLQRIEAGEIASVCFAAPTEGWTLPVFELALLTASWCAERHVAAVELTVATPEHEPLALFGRAATRAVEGLLADRGIRFVTGAAGPVPADAVIALPRLVRSPLPGVPADDDGFFAVDEHQAVVGMDRVYAVGDCVDFPVKQGGLAAQQADAAAEAIAQRLGAPVTPRPYRPVLRGLLLTGVAPTFLRSGGDASEAAFDALWWPPSKVAGTYLGPYLSGAAEKLVDRPAPSDPDRAARDREDVSRIAADLARAEARWGDHQEALRWIDAVERLEGALSAEMAELRDRCRAAL